MRAYPAVHIEGGLFAPDLLDQLMAAELSGQRARDFGLEGSRRNLTDEIAATFAYARARWGIFQRRLAKFPSEDPATAPTRHFVTSFLGLLGYELQRNPRAYQVGGLSFAISHRAGQAEEAPPVHIVGANQELGRLAPSGRPRLAPHSLVQEFLNRTEALWGLVTNGRTLRLLRDSTYLRRQCYLEFDLEAIFEQQLFPDFVVLYRLLHRSRLPHSGEDITRCLLEQYYQHSLEQGGRVRERLREGVEECLKRLGDGFLAHPDNHELRRRLTDPEHPAPISPEDFYRQLLHLVYRFLFLLVSEDRGLISDHPLYRGHYGVARLRRLVDRRGAYDQHHDLWYSLRVLWKVFSDDKRIPQLGGRTYAAVLGAPVLNGQLFQPIDLDTCTLYNRDLLEALRHLIYYSDSGGLRRVNYAALDTEELGSVYESLLDYHPRIDTSGPVPRFALVFGSERKSTGSYYTPPELVAELVRSALEPLMAERLKSCNSREEKERALLSLKVCDPACGSGHFLLAAARRLGKELARVRTGEEEPAPDRVREAIREVVAHCLYGVDKNPLAVELCRVALWLEAHTPGKPLTFLDHRIKCGDSLVGVFDLAVLEQGIPDAAFKPVSGDDKEWVKKLKRDNRHQRKAMKQLLLAFDPRGEVARLGAQAQALDRIPDDAPEDIREKRRRHQELEGRAEASRTACHLWTAAFFQPRHQDTPRGSIITTVVLRDHLERGAAHHQAVAQAQTLAQRHRFFHWPLEFPEVFAQGGFDLVLGNPPWERIKLQEKEFFAIRDREIASAPNAAARKPLIENLARENPELWEEYRRALHAAESTSRFLRESGSYPLTGRGDINTYSVFAERMYRLLGPGGRAGLIVPTGIATDDTNKRFFAHLVDRGALASLFDFENREGIFPGVHRSYKFSLLTLRRQEGARGGGRIRLAFFCTRAEHLHHDRRVFALGPEDIARINPNTRTLPVFRTRQDAELTRAIYQRVPVLVNQREGENPWGVRFQTLFHMSNDSHHFRTAEQLREAGLRRVGNRFLGRGELWLPLYEAKMIWHYDHRFGSYAGVASRRSTHLPTTEADQHADPGFLAQPWYWVPAEEVDARLQGWPHPWLLGFRRITNATNERTAIFSLLPFTGAGDNIFLMLPNAGNTALIVLLKGNLISIVFDWVVRQKLAGVNMNFFYVEQLPVLPPSAYTDEELGFIVPRVLELVYTAWDLKPFADEVWNHADEGLRRAIRRQWEDSAAAAGGHRREETPDWLEAFPEVETDPARGIPLAPFPWQEERRARLRAELDACYARLYGLTRKQLRYILDPADLTRRELADILDPWEEVADPLDPEDYARRTADSDFPGETFRVLKEKEMRQCGEYRTRRLVLEAWEKTARRKGERRRER